MRFENLSPNLKSFSCLQFMCILDSVGNPTVSSLLANFLRFHYPHKSIKNIDKKCFEATRLTFSLLSVKASLTCLKKNLAMRNFCKCKSFASILQQSWLCLKTQWLHATLILKTLPGKFWKDKQHSMSLRHHVSVRLVHVVALPLLLFRISRNYKIRNYGKRPMTDSHFSERQDPGNDTDIGEDVICNLIHV